MTHSYVWRDSFECVTWLVQIYGTTHSIGWHDSLVYATRLIHPCDVTHLFGWRDSSIRVTRPIHLCDMSHARVWNESSILVTLLVLIALSICWHWHAWHDSSVYVTWLVLIEPSISVVMCVMTHLHVLAACLICLIHMCKIIRPNCALNPPLIMCTCIECACVLVCICKHVLGCVYRTMTFSCVYIHVCTLYVCVYIRILVRICIYSRAPALSFSLAHFPLSHTRARSLYRLQVKAFMSSKGKPSTSCPERLIQVYTPTHTHTHPRTWTNTHTHTHTCRAKASPLLFVLNAGYRYTQTHTHTRTNPCT